MLLLRLLVGPFAHDLLLGAHLPDQLVDACGEVLDRVAGVVVEHLELDLVAEIGERALHVDQGEADLRGDAGAGAGGFGGLQLGDAGEPILELVVEAPLRVAGLQIEEAQDQRAGEAEHRAGEGRAHALERAGQAFLQLIEQHHALAGIGVERADGGADRGHRLQQAPERAEQAEKDEQADQIARRLALLVEAGGDGVEQRAHRAGGQRQMPGAVVQHGGHRREQRRRGLVGGDAGIGDAEIVDPVDLGIEPQHLAERIDDADHQHADDQRIQAGIGQEAVAELSGLAVEDDREQHGEDEEQAHAPQEDLRAGELHLVSDRRHQLPF